MCRHVHHSCPQSSLRTLETGENKKKVALLGVRSPLKGQEPRTCYLELHER